MRYMMNQKAREIGLGLYPELSLADARKKHFEARILIAEGKDPLSERRKALAQTKREALTRFSDVAESYIEEHRFKWTNASAKYLYQIRNNISHRGIGGYDADIPIIDASLKILLLTIQNLLNIEDKFNH